MCHLRANYLHTTRKFISFTFKLQVTYAEYEKAAASGSMQANHNLGMIFAEGRGTTQSWVRALRYFEVAANDIPASRYMIGYSYFQGEGNIQNRPRAFREFMNAGLDSYADAQYMLAFMFLDGSGVPKQPLQAYIWAKLADENKQLQAAELIDAASNRISAKQKSRADILFSQCLDAGLVACGPAISALD